MLEFKNLLRTAFKSILKNRMRSLLTSLGIIIGVSSVIIMTAIGQGSSVQIAQKINSLGTDLIMISPSAIRSGGVSLGAGSRNRLTMEDAEKLKKNATLLKGVSPVVTAGSQIIGGGNNWSTTVYGVSPEYFEIKNWQLDDGEFFTDKEVRSRKKVCLLGKTVADALFPNQTVIGETVRIRNIPFTVIGTLKSKGEGPGQDQDDVIIAPSTTVLYRLRGGQYINMINASAKSSKDLSGAQEEIRALLRESHRLTAGTDDDFTIRTQAEIASTASEMTGIMTMLLGAVAGVSLIVGGIGIMNIMLVSVTERTREIGIRLSVGARASDVLAQFLTESIVLSFSGGVIGIAFSFLVSTILNNFTGLYTVISPAIILISVMFSVGIGVFFGFYPARKASQLNPIDALRYE